MSFKKLLLLVLFIFFAFGQQYLVEDFETPWTGDPLAPPGWRQVRIIRVYNSTTPGIPEPPGTTGEKDWQRVIWNSAMGRWEFEDGTAIPAVGFRPTGAFSGSGALYMEDYYFSTSWWGARRLESPTINLSTATSPYVRFRFCWAQAPTTDHHLKVVASSDGGTTWRVIQLIAPDTALHAGIWTPFAVIIPDAFKTENA
ncbi:MAG: hypothetical protein NZ891_07140 [bacterium]|nr:hypothetical protein [bacterium]MDW8164498.1 hypothetical protein [Candidatus Omnitrophota bacterium]